MSRQRFADDSLVGDMAPISHPSSLGDLAYQALKEQVLGHGHLESDRLDERIMAERLGVSRTPLREAIHRLAAEGFLRIEPRRGVFVVKKTKREIVEILQVRAALESMAARLATHLAGREDVARMKALFAEFTAETVEDLNEGFAEANVAFHEMMLGLSGNHKLVEMASHIFEHMRMVRVTTMRAGGRAAVALEEHLRIVRAVEERQADRAAELMREHILGLAHYVESTEGLFPWDDVRKTSKA